MKDKRNERNFENIKLIFERAAYNIMILNNTFFHFCISKGVSIEPKDHIDIFF